MNLLEQISQTHTIFNWPALIVLNYSHNDNAHILDTNLSLFVFFKKRKACESTSTLTLIWSQGIKIHDLCQLNWCKLCLLEILDDIASQEKAWKTVSHMIVFFWISSKSRFQCRTYLRILHSVKFSQSIFSKQNRTVCSPPALSSACMLHGAQLLSCSLLSMHAAWGADVCSESWLHFSHISSIASCHLTSVETKQIL